MLQRHTGGHTKSNIGPDPHDAAPPYDTTSVAAADAGSDAGSDDTGSNAGSDASSDTSSDDAGSNAGSNAGSDAGSDASSEYVPSVDPSPTAPSTAATPQVTWVDLEAVVAVHSEGLKIDDNIKQAIAYTGYVLASRPDRVAVLGLYLGSNGFALVLADPTGVYHTDCLPWKPPSSDHSGRGKRGQRGQGGPPPLGRLPYTLLRRVLHYINDPPKTMIDPTITREEGGTFEITFRGKVFKGCMQKWFPSLEHWTVVFETSQGASIPIFKEQYLCCEGDSVENMESRILKMIHDPGVIPGVVRVGEFGPVTQEDGHGLECGLGKRRRQKVRLELKDQGESFMAIKKPYDALVAIWDLLEGDTFTPHLRFCDWHADIVTRCLYKERNVLHRDLSKGNVLFTKPDERNSSDGSMHNCKDIGYRSQLMHFDSDLPYDTPTLLIDFDHAEVIQGKREQSAQRQTVGTPIFMARAAVAGHPLVVNERSFYLYDLPLLSDRARQLYEAKLPERLERFPQPAADQDELLCILKSSEVAPNRLQELPWFHELRHDAESAFWLLVWWAVHILSPAAKTPNHPDASKIPSNVWQMLTNVDLNKKEDPRKFFLIWLTRPHPEWLDPTYRGLEPLFQEMAKLIHHDLHWAPRTPAAPVYMREPEFLHEALQRVIFNFLVEHAESVREPEFLHEALQRVIFNFLVEHAESESMQLEKYPKHRKVTRGYRSILAQGSECRLA